MWYLFGPLAAGLFLLGFTSGGGDRQALVATAGILLLIGLPFQLLIDRTRLELSAEGVQLRQTGYKLQASWDDIAELRLERGREGFVTNKPITSSGAKLLAAFRAAGMPGAPLYDARQQALLAEQRFIPIEAFAWHLRHGKLYSDITRLAPQLPQPLDTPNAATKAQRMTLWLLISISSVVIGGTIAIAMITESQSENGAQRSDAVITVIGASVVTFLALRAGYGAWRVLRRRQWVSGIVLIVSAIILFLLGLAWWGNLISGGR